MHPTVSVIIPNYNHAPYLRERIESVIRQKFDDIEVIILDDCSTDNSHAVIEEYRGNPKVSHIEYNLENSGTTFAQWRKGLLLSRGKYVWIAESDDMADETFLSTLIPLLEANPRAAMAFSGSNIIDSLGNQIPGADWDKFGKRIGSVTTYGSEELIGRKLLRNNLIYNASMVVFRRDCAPDITPEYLAMKFCGDWLFWSRLATRGEAVEVCRKLNNFRQHKRKVSTSAAKEGKTYTEGLKVVCEMADNLRLTPLQRKAVAGRICKRLRKFPGLLDSDPDLKTQLGRLASTATPHPPLLALIYEVDKLLDFAHLPKQTR